MDTPEEVLEKLTALSHYLGDPDRDLAILGEGNTSARVDEDTFYVKASGQHLGTITPNGFCAVNFSRILPYFDKPDLTDTEVKQVLLASGAEPNPSTPEELAQLLRSEVVKWNEAAKAAGLRRN